MQPILKPTPAPKPTVLAAAVPVPAAAEGMTEVVQPIAVQPAPQLVIGQIVLFSLGGGGLNPPILRPLVVTSFFQVGDKPTKVRGILLFDAETDRHHPWVQLMSKVTPLPASPITWAEGSYGVGVGEWRYPGDRR